MFKKIFVVCLLFVFTFSLSAFAALEIADSETLEEISKGLQGQLDGEIVVNEAWVVDFPDITEDRFYKVVATVGGEAIDDLYVDAETYTIVESSVIEEYREKEEEEGIVRTLTADTEDDEEDTSLDSEEPASSDDNEAEAGIIDEDNDAQDSGGSFFIILIVILVVAGVVWFIAKSKK